MRHYLTVRADEIPRISEVYEAFKKYARSPRIAEHVVDNLVEDFKTVVRRVNARRGWVRFPCASAIRFRRLRQGQARAYVA